MKQRFENLVDQHGPRLLQLACLLLRSNAEAEDVVQECLVRLWHHLADLHCGAELGWLITCTRNACLDRLRAHRRRQGLLVAVAAVTQSDPAPGFVCDARTRPDDAELAADWDLKQSLRAMAPTDLPAPFRQRIVSTTRRPFAGIWWPALAAAVVLSVAIVLVLEPHRPELHATAVSSADLAELQLALDTLDDSIRRTRLITGRELASSLSVPTIEIDDLPYGRQVRDWIQPARSRNNQGVTP
jgi:DNA-directed RNA polymerase specialized sigma24 family protein